MAERLKGEEGASSTLRIIPSTDIPPPSGEALDGLLGPFLPQPPALVLLSGETSAGKTVLSHNIAHALAEGVEFAGMAHDEPLRVLYVDMESPEQVHRDLVDTIGRSPNWAFIRVLPRYLNTDEGRDALRDAIRAWQATVVIVDPLSVAWPVGDENDNAVADRQMWELKQIAVGTGSVIVALWNMGEGNVKEKFKSRGATARMDRADVGINYTELTESARLLKVIKSRYGTLGMSLTLRFAGDMSLEAVDTGEGITPNLVTEAQEAIKDTLGKVEKSLKRKDICERLPQYPKTVIDKALRKLVLAKEINRPAYGEYKSLPVCFPYIGQSGKVENSDSPSYGHLVTAALESGAEVTA
jgi:archaellum biogenesis ATPase FlaH